MRTDRSRRTAETSGVGGIVGAQMDLKAVPRGWAVVNHTTATLLAILQHVGAPRTIHYLSLGGRVG